MKIKFKKLRKDIFLVTFKTQYEMAATLLRFQEHYENPKFHGTIFHLEEFMDWYAKKYGNFTYYSDWAGFNFPSYVLKEFWGDSDFEPLSVKELTFLNIINEHDHGDYYVIGVSEGRSRTEVNRVIDHEFAHALYYLEPEYWSEVNKIMRQYYLKDIKRLLRASCYATHVLMDEIQAYAISPAGKIGEAYVDGLAVMAKRIRKVYDKYSEGIKYP